MPPAPPLDTFRKLYTKISTKISQKNKTPGPPYLEKIPRKTFFFVFVPQKTVIVSKDF